MSVTEDAIVAILRRYRDWVNAGMPTDETQFRFAASFARIHRYAQSPGGDRELQAAALSVESLVRFATKRQASLKTISRVLSAVSTEAGAP